MNRILTAAVIGAVALFAHACTEPADRSDLVPVEGVKVTPQSLQLAIGEAKQLSATVSPANATDPSVVWESTDSTVVSVDSNGRVTGKHAGSAVFVTVFTQDRQHQASVNVTVNP